MIVADTSALVALIRRDDPHHHAVRALWEATSGSWVVPWAVLPEVDYLVRRHLGPEPARLFLRDVADGAFPVEHGLGSDLVRAAALDAQHASLGLGLVDGVVVAVAERLRADAIATLDVRHFGALGLPIKLYPRDL
jgi:predicted nucleic acid-binding protein